MRVTVLALLAPVLAGSLSGCVLPPAVSVAGMLLDGISYVATEKSVNDHVLSEAMESDCAVWRAVKDGLVCRAYARGEQGLLATVADTLDDEFSASGAGAAAGAAPVGQVSAIEPAGAAGAAPGQ